MDVQSLKERHVFEIMLIVLVLGMTMLFAMMGQHGLLALNLFFLPVLLCGYFLGRGSAGVMALLSVLAVTIAATWFLPRFGAYDTPVMVGLALTIWAAVLGLAAILMGTLCDERHRTVNELHRAYVGVVEVLFKYLQSSNPQTKARSIRVSELCQRVAMELKLPRKQIDDIRVAALLRDLESVEVTTQLISKAVNTLERDADKTNKHTFLGTDLVHSLGSVLEGALPLIASQNDDLRECLAKHNESHGDDVMIGAKIISVVRAYDALTNSDSGGLPASPYEALRDLGGEDSGHEQAVVDALACVVPKPMDAKVLEPVHV
ncbi:MAG TPA: HD domain-containing phosphohydrolase [Phycisphaerae bacterium]|nr:HD domain-containing phosphohydrolase [Phycisphaerae bacterium]